MRQLTRTLRKVQPARGTTRVDWSNPITRAMDFALNFAETDGRKVLNSATETQIGNNNDIRAEIGTGPHGVWAAMGEDLNDRWVPDHPTIAEARSLVWLWGLAVPSIGIRGMAASFSSSGAADSIYYNSSNFLQVFTASSNRSAAGTASRIETVCGVDYANARYKIYNNGFIDATSTSGGGNPALFGILGAQIAAASQSRFRCYCWLSWRRVLSPGEHLSLANNIWQVFV